jgi:hypothetical protein
LTTEIDTTASQFEALSKLPQAFPQSGFEDDEDAYVFCGSAEHYAPDVFVPSGKRYRHVCPACGMISYVRGSEFLLH